MTPRLPFGLTAWYIFVDGRLLTDEQEKEFVKQHAAQTATSVHPVTGAHAATGARPATGGAAL